jgi:outer membrane protein
MQLLDARAWLAASAVIFLLSPALAAADFKVGFVDQRRGVLSTVEGKQAQQQIESLVEKRRSEFQPRQEQLEQRQKDLEAQRFVLSQEALEERALEIEKQRRELERDFSAIKDDLALEERKMLKPIAERWEKAVKQIADEKDFDMIIDRSTPGVLYYRDAHDITDLIVQRMNKMK